MDKKIHYQCIYVVSPEILKQRKERKKRLAKMPTPIDFYDPEDNESALEYEKKFMFAYLDSKGFTSQ